MTPCDLCALDCGSKPFELAAPGGMLQFCCEGCRGIYEMLHEINTEPDKPVQNADLTSERRST
jgi:hypothetical protein